MGSISKAREHGFGRIHRGAGGKRVKARLYIIWYSMKQRCLNPNRTDYYRYGGVGISVDQGWSDDYAVFRAWALANGYGKGLTLDRIDPSGNYEPSNCQWIPAHEQQWNARTSIRLTLDGVTKTLPVWAYELGFTPEQLRCRYYSGWTDKEILMTPLGTKRTDA